MSLTPILIEFVGGPLDGELRHHWCGIREYRIPATAERPWTGGGLASISDATPMPTLRTTEGLYTCRAGQLADARPQLFDWQGWQ